MCLYSGALWEIFLGCFYLDFNSVHPCLLICLHACSDFCCIDQALRLIESTADKATRSSPHLNRLWSRFRLISYTYTVRDSAQNWMGTLPLLLVKCQLALLQVTTLMDFIDYYTLDRTREEFTVFDPKDNNEYWKHSSSDQDSLSSVWSETEGAFSHSEKQITVWAYLNML